MAIQPSDLGEAFVKSGRRLITQRSADDLLGRASIKPITPKMMLELDPNQDWFFHDSAERLWACVRQPRSFISEVGAWLLIHRTKILDGFMKSKTITSIFQLLFIEGSDSMTQFCSLTLGKNQTNNLSTKSTNIMKPTLSSANTPQNARVNIDQPRQCGWIHGWTPTPNWLNQN